RGRRGGPGKESPAPRGRPASARPKTTRAAQQAARTATASARTGGAAQQKARDMRGLGNPMGGGPTASDREGRSAAPPAGGVRVLEGEPGLLEVALVVQGDAVQVLRTEAVDEAAHAGALDDDVVLGRFVFDAEAVPEPRAPARQHADPEPGGLGGDLL